jgi:predicted HTH transcriptional regulator
MSLVDAYLQQRPERSKLSGRLGSKEDILLNIGCAVRAQGVLRPTNAGLLLFGFEPQQFLIQAEVVCVLYKPTTGKQQCYADRRILHGPITEQIDQAEAFFKQYIPIAARMEGFHRIDEPDYPLEALREAVVNAVVHRDYSIKNEAVRIFYYPERIEVHNPGMLMPGLTLEDLQQGAARSKPRNPVVATVLRDFPGGYMERVGSGIRFMIDQMRELGRPDPQFRERNEFLVTFFREESPAGGENKKQTYRISLPSSRGRLQNLGQSNWPARLLHTFSFGPSPMTHQ